MKQKGNFGYLFKNTVLILGIVFIIALLVYIVAVGYVMWQTD